MENQIGIIFCLIGLGYGVFFYWRLLKRKNEFVKKVNKRKKSLEKIGLPKWMISTGFFNGSPSYYTFLKGFVIVWCMLVLFGLIAMITSSN